MKIKSNYFTTQEIVFITTMVAFDIAMGMFLKPLLGLTGITAFIRIDMILPLAIIFFTRRWVNKFGTIIVYELLWAIAASFVMPMSFDTPGLLKLLAAFVFSLTFELLYYFLPKKHNINIWVSAILGSILNKVVLLGIKIMLGFPFMNIVKYSFFIQLGTMVFIAMLAETVFSDV
jgi:hypothetical protein